MQDLVLICLFMAASLVLILGVATGQHAIAFLGGLGVGYLGVRLYQWWR